MASVVVQEHDFEIQQEYDALRRHSPKAGAIVFFVGLVRDFHHSSQELERIERIELEHYAGMTERVCLQLCEQAEQRFDVDAIRLVHRVGSLTAQEQIVFVATSSKHRKAAFECAQYVMDFLKTQAPIWKKEVGTHRHEWVGMKESDSQAAEQWQSS